MKLDVVRSPGDETTGIFCLQLTRPGQPVWLALTKVWPTSTALRAASAFLMRLLLRQPLPSHIAHLST